MNNERVQEILQKLAKRLDLVTTGTLLLLLILVGYLFMAEQNYNVAAPPPPSPLEWQVKLPLDRVTKPSGEPYEAANQEQYASIEEYLLDANLDIQSDEQARRLVMVNMFDVKTVEEEERLQTELNQRYAQAERFFQQGRYDQALSIVNEILDQDPRHREAQDLRERLNQLLEGGGDEPDGEGESAAGGA